MKPDTPTEHVFTARLLVLIESYETELTTLAARWPDDALLDSVTAIQCEMQAHVRADLAAPWTAMSNSHAGLLSQLARGPTTATERFDLLEAHLGSLLELEGACLSQLNRLLETT